VASADFITVTKSAILYSLNKPEDFILAIVDFLSDGAFPWPSSQAKVHLMNWLNSQLRREDGRVCIIQ
jgi:hypothetical protein